MSIWELHKMLSIFNGFASLVVDGLIIFSLLSFGFVFVHTAHKNISVLCCRIPFSFKTVERKPEIKRKCHFLFMKRVG